MTHTQREKKPLIETVPKEAQMLDLIDRHIESTTLKMFKEQRKLCLENEEKYEKAVSPNRNNKEVYIEKNRKLELKSND